MTNVKKSNQIPDHGRKMIDVEKMELLSTGSELAIETLTHWYLMEGLPMPQCELCHSRAVTLKHLLTDCANLSKVNAGPS